jgi:hypothetical protein
MVCSREHEHCRRGGEPAVRLDTDRPCDRLFGSVRDSVPPKAKNNASALQHREGRARRISAVDSDMFLATYVQLKRD